MITLTKATVQKLYAVPISTRVWNGNFNVAEIEISNNKKRYTLRYALSHPLLERFSGKRDKVEFIVWEGCRGSHEKIPDELDELVGWLRKSATMDDSTAVELYGRNAMAVQEFQQAFFGHRL